MSTRTTTAEYILEQIAAAGTVSIRKMFGEYAVYCDGKTIGLICDDQLFIKPTKAGAKFLGPCDQASPYPGAKHYFLIPGEKWDNHRWLSQLVKLTAAELPIPKPKPSSKKKKAK